MNPSKAPRRPRKAKRLPGAGEKDIPPSPGDSGRPNHLIKQIIGAAAIKLCPAIACFHYAVETGPGGA
ncbi:hypothetical protein EYF80_056722 [Liparis tanakae]|uniref:Uncharacterized protein n=1 Tax=Liparis tanakae TaxID=230148 RepID=A0A4Z2EW64_9TELE|nr:hypothetical protein EYF80_056722 [Liparis tanakae]